MNKQLLVRILRPTALFAVMVLLLAVVTSTAFAQSGTPYILTGTDVVCGDAALTQNCDTFAGVAVTYVDVGGGVVQIFNQSGVAAGFMKAPVVVAPEEVAVNQPASTRTVNLNFGGMWAPIGNRLAEVWAYGLFDALFLLAAIITIPFMPPVENKIEERVFLNEYFIKFVIGVAVSIMVQYLTVHGKLDWLFNWIVLKTGQEWVPKAFPWLLGIVTVVVIWYGSQVIIAESGSSVAVNQDAIPETLKFASEAERTTYMNTTMVKDQKRAQNKGYSAKADKPYWVIVVSIVEKAKQDRSYLTATLFLIWFVLEIFGVFITTIRTSLVGLDIFDVIPVYAVFVQFKEEIYNELGGTWSRVLQTLLVGILVGGMYLIITTLADMIPATNWWAFLSGLPKEVAGLFLPLLYLLLQGKGKYAAGTTDILQGILMGTVVLIQVIPGIILG